MKYVVLNTNYYKPNALAIDFDVHRVANILYFGYMFRKCFHNLTEFKTLTNRKFHLYERTHYMFFNLFGVL